MTSLRSEFITLREAAFLYGVSVRFLYNLREKGQLDFHKLGNRSYIRQSEIEQCFERTIYTKKT